jgi:Fe2+ transport system protein B
LSPESAARLTFSIPWMSCSALLTVTVVFLSSF